MSAQLRPGSIEAAASERGRSAGTELRAAHWGVGSSAGGHHRPGAVSVRDNPKGLT